MGLPEAATVLIRSKDEARHIGRTLEIVASQTVAAQVLVVDSGSTDATVDIARAAGAEVIQIAAASFTYGYALNVGCAAARADVVVALSAHAFAPDAHWLERVLAWFDQPRVACVYGAGIQPGLGRLSSPLLQDRELAERFPESGYSNSAGAFRKSLWERRRFREDMPGTEDKEWAWHWLREGWLSVVDPALAVDHSIHHDDPLRAVFGKARREWQGYGMYLDLGRWRLRDALELWWCDQEGYRSRSRARLSPRRAAQFAGRYAAQRRG